MAGTGTVSGNVMLAVTMRIPVTISGTDTGTATVTDSLTPPVAEGLRCRLLALSGHAIGASRRPGWRRYGAGAQLGEWFDPSLVRRRGWPSASVT